MKGEREELILRVGSIGRGGGKCNGAVAHYRTPNDMDIMWTGWNNDFSYPNKTKGKKGIIKIMHIMVHT